MTKKVREITVRLMLVDSKKMHTMIGLISQLSYELGPEDMIDVHICPETNLEDEDLT